jgi:hypothetical protein
MNTNTGLEDPVVTVQQFTMGLAGNTGANDIIRAGQAYGPHGSHVGVNVFLSYSPTNEISDKFEEQTGDVSPDGVIYNCFFNRSRLDRDSLRMAILHIGRHAAEMRSPSPGITQNNLYAQEYSDWVMTAEIAAINRQNALALPGSFQLWMTSWTSDQQAGNVDTGITDFLVKEAGFTK